MKDLKLLLRELTIQEKAALVEGYQSWRTNAVPRVHIPAICLTDGPVGVRLKSDKGRGALGLGSAIPSTAFPTPATLANGWDVSLAREVGAAIGRECVALGVDVLLAPALNVKRDPRCGRNFEYYSEDPFLAGSLAAAFVQGVQGTGTAACVKHFALNNLENHRYVGNSLADERTKREIYLRAFEIAVKQGRPRALMCAYNQVDGVHCSENKRLLTEILRTEWGYEGLVMTDWGATKDRVKGLIAGVDLDMPGGVGANRRRIVKSVESGDLAEAVLDRAAARVLDLVSYATQEKPVQHMLEQLPQNHLLSARAAEECAVLLENDGTLPLPKGETILALGELFSRMRYQGAGSSGLRPDRLVSPKDAFESANQPFTYAKGYSVMEEAPDEALEEEALALAKDAKTVLCFIGLTELAETEGIDRPDLLLPQNQRSLVEKLVALAEGTDKKLVLVLFGGAPFDLEFARGVHAVLHMYLPGQGGGIAARRILFGEVCPSGKLAETWMRRTQDIPFGERFSKEKTEVYREGVFVGYRFYEEAPERIRYPFGHGLSYTAFDYIGCTLDAEGLRLEVTVKNSGSRDGAECVQIYYGKADSAVPLAKKNLIAFRKVFLAAGESRTVSFPLSREDFAYYHVGERRRTVEGGRYTLYIGASSRDIRLTKELTLAGEGLPCPYSQQIVSAYRSIATPEAVTDRVMEELIGMPLPKETKGKRFGIETPLREWERTAWGRMLLRTILFFLTADKRKAKRYPEGLLRDEAVKNAKFMVDLVPSNCPRTLVQSSGGLVDMNIAYALAHLANGRILSAIIRALFK